MTKKDFELIASIVRSMPSCIRGLAAHYFCARLGQEFPAFNSKKFMSACIG